MTRSTKGDQVPPIVQTADVEAEECYLGSLLLNEDAFYQAGWVTPDDFQDPQNRWVFEAISRCYEHMAGEAFSFLAVEAELRRSGRVGPGFGLIEYPRERIDYLTSQLPSPNHAEHYALRIRQARRRLELKRAIERAAGLVTSQNGIDPIVKTAGLLASIEESFPDPSTSKIERHSTMRDLENILGPIAWDWPGWLARGFGTLIAAEPGTGKSMLALRVAACFLLGWPWPDGTPYTGERGRVLWCETEAGQAMNLQRAHDWGLPVDQILFPTGNPLDNISLEDPRHLESIRRLSELEDVRLIVVDSFSGSHGKDENDTDAGRVIRGVAEIARDNDRPLLITHHLNKLYRSNRITLTNVRGSTAIAQFVRMIWAMDKPDPDKSEAIRMYTIKNNLGPLASEIGLTITANGMQTLQQAPQTPKGDSVAQQAAELLMELLGREPLLQRDVVQAFEEAGMSEAAADRAKKRLGVLSVKKSDSKWYWSLPARVSDEQLH